MRSFLNPKKLVKKVKQRKILVVLNNQMVFVGPEWRAMKEATMEVTQNGKKILDVWDTDVRTYWYKGTLEGLIDFANEKKEKKDGNKNEKNDTVKFITAK